MTKLIQQKLVQSYRENALRLRFKSNTGRKRESVDMKGKADKTVVEVRGFLKDKRLLTGHGESKDGLQG